jgi:hypothetical protein
VSFDTFMRIAITLLFLGIIFGGIWLTDRRGIKSDDHWFHH